jgi:hypothetical protein
MYAGPRYSSELSGTTEVSNSESHSYKAKISSSKGYKVKLNDSKAKACLSKHKHKNHSKNHKAEKKIIQCKLNKEQLDLNFY